jgi:hypothetical protein
MTAKANLRLPATWRAGGMNILAYSGRTGRTSSLSPAEGVSEEPDGDLAGET